MVNIDNISIYIMENDNWKMVINRREREISLINVYTKHV